MYIFWDNSNIHFSGVNYACPKFEPSANTVLYRTYFRNLFQLVCQGRDVHKACFAGSVPPKEDDLWSYIDDLKIKVQLMDRTASGKEQESVDIYLQNEILHAIIDETPDTIAIITGDGAGFLQGTGFLAELDRARKLGWNIEVYSWEGTCNAYLKEYAEKHGAFISLDKYYFSISFIKKDKDGKDPGRVVAKLIL